MAIRPLFKTKDCELIEKFHKVEDFNTLADLLEFNAHGLKRIFYEIRRQDKHYQEFFIRKKSGGERQIFAPDYKLKLIQRRLAYALSLMYMGRVSVHGFRQGKSIITNAERHIQRRALLNIDLEDFFPTIHFGRVRGILQARPYSLSRAGATIVAGFCCYKSKLPQGAPTSPIVSNMICSKLDHELQRLAYDERCTYSRYADDIVFSTTKRNGFSSNMLKGGPSEWSVGLKLDGIITTNGFMVNQRKTRVRFHTERQEVTGLIVNSFPNVKRGLIREARIMLHVWRKFGIKSASKQYSDTHAADFYEVLRGKINFIKLVKTKKDNTYKVLAEKFNARAKKSIFEIVPIKSWPEEAFFSAGEHFQGMQFLREIFSLADRELFILDGYLTGNIIGLLEEQIKKNPSMIIKLFISRKSSENYNKCVQDLKQLIKLHPEAQIDCRSGGLPKKIGRLHGRFIIIDEEEIYHSGHSLGELGRASDHIGRVRTESVKNKALDDVKSLFNNTTKVNLTL